ncbi:Papain family cysteine protease [uncultured virus]|nr:Papain family cysteine protease [uncultured virus]
MSYDEVTFNEWIVKNDKLYKNEVEKEYRFNIWLSNVEFINFINNKNQDFVLEINKFTDLNWDEFRTNNMGYSDEKYVKTFSKQINNYPDLPKFVNWTALGMVTPVKNQYSCGSCWAFSTTGTIESMNAIKTGKLISLSEENLIDCSFNFGNQGCGGGLPSLAMDYVISNLGIDTENSYPLTSVFYTDCLLPSMCPCLFNETTIGSTISSYESIQSGNETDLQYKIAFHGPISVAICATQSFQFYKKGVFSDKNCSTKTLNHAVLVVGYGTTDNNIDYYIVKNSWGSEWGLNGYILMARNQNNMCGIATKAIYPII